jgi:Sulfotransferase family
MARPSRAVVPPPEGAELVLAQRSKCALGNRFFLVGAEHSGATLTGLMLDHHPMISFGFDFQYAVELMPDGDGWPDLGDYCEYLRGHSGFQAAELVIAAGQTYTQMVDSFLEQKRRRDRKLLIGATVHRDFDRLLRVWPDARFIHIVRDGRDVAWSLIAKGLAGNAYFAVEGWLAAEVLWSRLRRELPPDRWMEIRYETLVTQPEATLTGLCDFLGVPFDRAMLNYPSDTIYGAPSPHAIGRWQRRLSPDSVRLAEARIGDMLVELGYEHSGLPRLELSPQMESRLHWHDRFYRALFRWLKHGTRLFLADLVARRLGSRSWRLEVQSRMAAQFAKTILRGAALQRIRDYQSRELSSIPPAPHVIARRPENTARRGISQVGPDGLEPSAGDSHHDRV